MQLAFLIIFMEIIVNQEIFQFHSIFEFQFSNCHVNI